MAGWCITELQHLLLETETNLQLKVEFRCTGNITDNPIDVVRED